MLSNISKNSKIFPKISIIIPTLNSERVLISCLNSIKIQKYQNYEILICDGGSTDNTVKIAKSFGAKILKNPLKTAETGKAIGLKNINSKYVAFIDSDNILPTSDWLNQMIRPLENDSKIIGSEPWEFTYRKNSGFIERYSALIGANDPYAYVTGIYDRKNFITKKWTALDLPTKNYPKYIKIKLLPHQPIPTIGANGTLFRTRFIKSNFNSKYLFDIDLITKIINYNNQPLFFAKTKNGVIHTYCESSISKFYKKQIRRIKDFFQYQNIRTYDYKSNMVTKNIKYVLYTIFIIPMLITTARGLIAKPDLAWLFHPLACIITLYCYLYVSLSYYLGFYQTQSRKTWSQ